MKTKIKVKVLVPGCEPEIIAKGDWIDLKAACSVDIPAPQAGVQFQRGNVKYRNVEIPTVYISLGTVNNNNKDFYQNCFKALKDEKLRAIMSVGEDIDFEKLYLPQFTRTCGN